MTSAHIEVIQGYEVRTDLAYDRDSHLWVQRVGAAIAPRARVGMDALEVATTGTLAQVALVGPGAVLRRGEAYGSVEAEKFVGPLVSPVSGRVWAVNSAVESDPGLLERDPYGSWLIELELEAPEECSQLVQGPPEVRAWFDSAVSEYKLRGVLAE